MTPADTPCAGCPSPILAGAPRQSVQGNTLRQYHPGCWAAEQRRTVPA